MSDDREPERWQKLRHELESTPYWRILGVSVEELGNGYSRLRMPIRPQIRTSADGPIHPGALTCLIELAVAAAAEALEVPKARVDSTAELSATFLTLAAEDVVAEGRILSVGDQAATGEAVIREEGGQVVAKGSATCLFTTSPG